VEREGRDRGTSTASRTVPDACDGYAGRV